MGRGDGRREAEPSWAGRSEPTGEKESGLRGKGQGFLRQPTKNRSLLRRRRGRLRSKGEVLATTLQKFLVLEDKCFFLFLTPRKFREQDRASDEA